MRMSRLLGILPAAGGSPPPSEISLSTSLTQYVNRVSDSKPASGYTAGKGSGDYYAVRIAFTPAANLTAVKLQLRFKRWWFGNGEKYRAIIASSCPANNATTGTEWLTSSGSQSGSAGSGGVTLTQTFTAGTTYYAWIWTSGNVTGYINNLTVDASGVAA